MSSPLDTLLEAARYIELQEQRDSLGISPAPTTLGGRYQNNHNHHHHHHNYYDNNSTNTINNSSSNNITINSNITRNNNSRIQQQQQQQHHNQVSSPPVSPGFNLTNGVSGGGTNNQHHHIVINNNNHEFSSSDYGSSPVLVPNSRSVEGRVEQPYINNGHSNTLHSTQMNITPSNLNTNSQNPNSGTNNLYNNRSFYNNNYKLNNNFNNTLPSSNSNITLTKNTVVNHNNNINNNSTNNKKSNMKFVPLTPPPMSSRKIIESTRIRSISLSSNKITANGVGGIIGNGIGSISGTAAATSASSLSIVNGGTSSIIGSNTNVHNVLVSATTEDSSQSSLNLSSSGYLSGSSVNSSIGGGSNLNLNTSMGPVGIILQGNNNSDHQIPIQPQSTSGRRRTTSTNSNGTQRSPSILRAGTREVHNKLEKHRRAHLKECFEQLKVQLQLKDEEKKKTSNLAILGAAYRHVMSLRRKEHELEQQVEQLAKEKINAQKKIVSLKRELSAKYENIDFSTIISDGDIGSIPTDRVVEAPCDSVSLSSGKGSIRYSSSSSLSSGTTISSPLGAGMTSGMPLAMSPVISSSSSNTSPSLNNLKTTTSSIINNGIPLSLTTTKQQINLNCNNNSMLARDSPTPSTPSPSPSSNGILSSSPIISSSSLSLSSSPPIGIKIPNNLPNGIKISNGNLSSNNHISIITSSSNNNNNNIMSTTMENGIIIPTTTTLHTTLNGSIPLNFNSSQNIQLSHNINTNKLNNNNIIPKDLSGKNGISRKNQLSENNRDISGSPSRVILSNCNGGNINNGLNGCGNNMDHMKLDDSEHPTKVIKLINGAIALAPVDKDNKIISSTPLSLSQVVGGGGLVVSPFQMLSSQGLRVIGTNGLATIELSSPSMQSQPRNHNQQTSTQSLTSVTPTTGAQLHKLLVNGGTTITGSNSLNNCNPTFTTTHANTINSVASELARLPGGAELNILPTGTNGAHTLYRGNGKLAIVNNNGGITTLKGSDTGNNSSRAVHVVTPIQSGNSPMSGLTPIVVSQGQPGNNLAHIIASSPQLAGKVNLSVGGQTLISTQYLSSIKPMVVTVANNSNPTLTSMPPNQTSATITTGKLNGST